MTEKWLEREAIVAVKAYPNPSAKYHETVCVAAITRDEGWVRLFPVSYRQLPDDQKFKKYQLIRLRMRKHDSDRRPESFRPDEDSIELLGTVSANDGWRQRWQWLRPTLGPSMCEFRRLQQIDGRSLGCIKPSDVSEFSCEAATVEWAGSKKAAIDQLTLFDQVDTKLEKIPYIFRYHYRCEDPSCNGHKQSVIDWELMELYRKLRNDGASPDDVESKIREKFLGELCGPKKDTHFIVGNHSRYPQSFMVLGVFWPPKSAQKDLFI